MFASLGLALIRLLLVCLASGGKKSLFCQESEEQKKLHVHKLGMCVLANTDIAGRPMAWPRGLWLWKEAEPRGGDGGSSGCGREEGARPRAEVA